MKILHHTDFRHWVEMEIMALFLIGMLAAILLPSILSNGLGKIPVDWKGPLGLLLRPSETITEVRSKINKLRKCIYV